MSESSFTISSRTRVTRGSGLALVVCFSGRPESGDLDRIRKAVVALAEEREPQVLVLDFRSFKHFPLDDWVGIVVHARNTLCRLADTRHCRLVADDRFAPRLEMVLQTMSVFGGAVFLDIAAALASVESTPTGQGAPPRTAERATPAGPGPVSLGFRFKQKRDFVRIQLRGRIGSEEREQRMIRDLSERIGSAVKDGARCLLVDVSEAKLVRSRSWLFVVAALVGEPWLRCRIAFAFGDNEKAREQFRASQMDRLFDCHGSPEEAESFLLSDRPTLREIYDSIGPEVGPERCTDPGCRNFRVDGSQFCRRHHCKRVIGIEMMDD